MLNCQPIFNCQSQNMGWLVGIFLWGHSRTCGSNDGCHELKEHGQKVLLQVHFGVKDTSHLQICPSLNFSQKLYPTTITSLFPKLVQRGRATLWVSCVSTRLCLPGADAISALPISPRYYCCLLVACVGDWFGSRLLIGFPPLSISLPHFPTDASWDHLPYKPLTPKSLP